MGVVISIAEYNNPVIRRLRALDRKRAEKVIAAYNESLKNQKKKATKLKTCQQYHT